MRGIETICDACKADDLPVPEFTVNPSDIMVKFTAPGDRVVHGPSKVTDAERRILDELRIDSGYSYVKIAENLGISKKTVAEHIKGLKDKGISERVGNNKTGHWRIDR